jgi:hypothetical protein
MHGAIPPLPQYAFMAWCSVKAQGQLYFYRYSATPFQLHRLCSWWIMNWKYGGKQPWTVLRHCPCVCLERIRKISSSLSQYGWSQALDWNSEAPEHKDGPADREVQQVTSSHVLSLRCNLILSSHLNISVSLPGGAVPRHFVIKMLYIFIVSDMYPTRSAHLSFLDTVSRTEPQWSKFVRLLFIKFATFLCYFFSVSRAVIALGYELDDWGSRVRFSTRAGNFSLHHRVQNGSGAHPASYPIGSRGSFPGGKAAGAWSWPLASI